MSRPLRRLRLVTTTVLIGLIVEGAVVLPDGGAPAVWLVVLAVVHTTPRSRRSRAGPSPERPEQPRMAHGTRVGLARAPRPIAS
ncbi:hypothetical protein [Streptomyces sp. NPDC102283]|uniref:hypothetical protein n=1 Tax=Streptomyces sp. NPDC102283 TaxID=3366155 RepID=UPI0038229624